ncbi:hypothetical protein AMECASPLE_033668 [Ameca splendens]|uniref:Uncharacterized protein n=1 Tax=Ameca splendens TaxID=208324 RepID=A0ABV0Y6T4_9TELE
MIDIDFFCFAGIKVIRDSRCFQRLVLVVDLSKPDLPTSSTQLLHLRSFIFLDVWDVLKLCLAELSARLEHLLTKYEITIAIYVKNAPRWSNSIKVMNRTGDKGQPCQSPTCTGKRSDLVSAMPTKLLLSLYRDRMAPDKARPIPYSWSTPLIVPWSTGHNEGHSQMPSPCPQNTCGPVGKTPMNPRVPCRGYRAGPVFHGRDENHTAPPEAEVRLLAGLSSPMSRSAASHPHCKHCWQCTASPSCGAGRFARIASRPTSSLSPRPH